MNWLKKLFNIFNKGKYEIVYSTYGTWQITFGKGFGYSNEYCNYEILFNDVTKHYKLECKGHMPKNHDMYPNLFKAMRKLNEGTAYIKGGEIYTKNSDNTKQVGESKPIDTMNETECKIYLAKALEEENYELAEEIKKRLEKL